MLLALIILTILFVAAIAVIYVLSRYIVEIETTIQEIYNRE